MLRNFSIFIQFKILKEKSVIIDLPFYLNYCTKKSILNFLGENGIEVINYSSFLNITKTLALKGYRHVLEEVLKYLVTSIRWILNLFLLRGIIASLAKKK